MNLRKVYTSGLSLVAGLTETANWSEPSQKAAVDRAVSAQAELTWAQTDDHGNVYSLDDGTVGQILAILMTPTEASRHQAGILTLTNEDPVQILIAPHKVSQLWAGVVLAHELVHAQDVLEGVEPASPTEGEWMAGEARAYRLQSQIVDRLSQGRLTRVLSTWMENGDLPVSREADQLVHQVARRLGHEVDLAEPASNTERAQQNAFYAVAALFASRSSLSEVTDAELDSADLSCVGALF